MIALLHHGVVAGEYRTLAAAVAASADGDSVLLPAGVYRDPFTEIHTRITIEGVGGMARLVADRFPPDGRAILRSTVSVTYRHLDISGATDAGGNGAAILHVGGDLVIEECDIHDNQDGVLTGSDIAAIHSIRITRSVFADNGRGRGFTHNIYVGANSGAFAGQDVRLVIRHCRIEGAVVGHEIKSRADLTVIADNLIASGPMGSDSYAIDLPNGGVGVIAGNVIEKGVGSANRAFIHFGGEPGTHAPSSLSVTGNLVVSDYPGVAVLVEDAIPAEAMTIRGNRLYRVQAGQPGNRELARRPGLPGKAP